MKYVILSNFGSKNEEKIFHSKPLLVLLQWLSRCPTLSLLMPQRPSSLCLQPAWCWWLSTYCTCTFGDSSSGYGFSQSLAMGGFSTQDYGLSKARVPPPEPFSIAGWSFSHVARSPDVHPPKGKSCPLPFSKTSPIMTCGQDVVENVGFYQNCGLVCRFVGFWHSLPDLHHWVSDSWKPLVAGPIELYLLLHLLLPLMIMP